MNFDSNTVGILFPTFAFGSVALNTINICNFFPIGQKLQTGLRPV